MLRSGDLSHFGLPGAFNAAFDRLIGRAMLRIGIQDPFELLLGPWLDFEAVAYAYSGDPHYPTHVLDVAFDLSRQVAGRRNSPHVQCGTQGSGESASNTRDDVVERGRELRPGQLTSVLILVKMADAAMNAEVDRFRKSLDVRRAVRAFVFRDVNAAHVNYRHVLGPFLNERA